MKFGKLIKSLVTPYALMCLAVFTLLRFSGVLINAYFYPYVAEQGIGIVRELATLCSAAVFLCVFLFAYFRPNFLNLRTMLVVGVVSAVLATVLVCVGYGYNNVPLFVIGVFGRSVAQAIAMALFALCLFKLDAAESVAFVVAVGYFLLYLLMPLAPVFGTSLNASIAIAAIILFALAWSAAQIPELLESIKEGGAASDLPLADPTAFLSPTHPFFQCIFTYSIFNGMALALNEVGHAPIAIGGWGFVIVLVVLYILVVKGTYQEDLMFSFTAIISMGALLVSPIVFNTDFAPVSNTLLRFGGDTFSILMWMCLVGMGKRNLYGYLPSVGYALALNSIGTTVGAVAGHLSNDLVAGSPYRAMGIVLVIAFMFFVFLWCIFRKFSFTDTIHGITAVSRPVGKGRPIVRRIMGQVPPAPVAAALAHAADSASASDGSASASAAAGSHPGSSTEAAPSSPASDAQGEGAEGESQTVDPIDENCQRIGEAAGLTKREMEIFIMMAHGRNGRFVMDYYTVSRNTAKSHIKHIYTKLDVHSHQELIDLAAGTEYSANEDASPVR